MTSATGTLADLRVDADAGVGVLMDLLAVARTLGVAVPDDEVVHRPVRAVADLDVDRLFADADCLSSVGRVVTEHLHHLPEQRILLDQGWRGRSGDAILARVADHQRRSESELTVLRTLADATATAAASVDRMLRTWYLTLARLAAPVIGGVPVAEVPAAILTGRLPLPVAAGDVAARIVLFETTARATVDGVETILDLLDRATDGFHAAAVPPTTLAWPHGAGPRAPDGRAPYGQAPQEAAPQPPVVVTRPDPTPDPDPAPDPDPTPTPPPSSEPAHDVPLTLTHPAPHAEPTPPVLTAHRDPGDPQAGPDSDLALAGDQ